MQPVKRISVSDQVFAQLQAGIARGEWRPGDKLPSENELALGLGVSRVTVRQAIQRLATLGLVETRLGEGTFVQTFTPGKLMAGVLPCAYLGENALLEVLEFRRIIEIPAAGLAAERARDADIRTLERIFRRMEAAQAGGDARAFFRADLDFHLELGGITHNSLVVETLTILRGILEAAMERIVDLRGGDAGMHYHRLLLDAVRAREPKRCSEIMTAHIDETIADMEKRLQNTRDNQ